MKKGLVSKLGGAALVLTLVTASLVGGTFAKYTKTIGGTAEATIAKFNVTATGLGENTTTKIQLEDLNNSNSNMLQPGSTGSIAIPWDSSGADVNGTISFKLGDGTNIPTNLLFYKGANKTDSITIPATGTVELANVSFSDTNKTGTVTLYWDWDGTGTDNAPEAAKVDMSFILTAVAEQTVPVAP